ncbi:mitochondrial import receptor subunit [Aspergillus sclerotioniger CBS 115572]|uniref:Mitochondrial import receptor subunit n=1 Tax=Aspergillus sclerotioniger CBS 115572 TaxID=1450535 RepID=A0A317W302_9EURO|nr:mitochondrial import receptor subunit [Aspergillus sclerotioniger CBS 115572]PWY78570.1 mitochondrial import receptor subunit [Aspergillus sclerotioniger CBS 115572]
MVLELHVWGPAFSLPSIDAQCLATIAYLSLTVPKDQWVLVASSDPSVSPTCELPALKDDKTWVSRFRNIVDYLRQYSNGDWDLDQSLTGLEKADNIAFSAFLESRAQSLLDLSLYVTSQNYYNCTSPSYGAILQWPNQWILPPQIHTAAKARTEHLGLSSLDLEAIEEQRKRDHSAAVAAGQVPKNLIPRPRDSVSSLLGKNSQQNQFKLEALMAELFEPLEEILGGKQYFLHTSEAGLTSLDCLALGYLSLALVPEVPNSWLRDAMRSKAPQVTEYTERQRKEIFGVVEIDHALLPDGAKDSSSILPWQMPQRARLATLGSTLLNTIADSTPIWKDIRSHTRMKEVIEESESLSDAEKQHLSDFIRSRKLDVWLSVGSVVGGIAAFIGYMALTPSKRRQHNTFAHEDEDENAVEYDDEIPAQPLQALDFLAGLE